MLYFDIYKIFWRCLLHRPSDPLLRNQKELRLTYKKIFLFLEQGMRRIMQQMTQKDFIISKYKIIGVVLSEWRECIFFSDQTLKQWGAPHFQDCKNKSRYLHFGSSFTYNTHKKLEFYNKCTHFDAASIRCKNSKPPAFSSSASNIERNPVDTQKIFWPLQSTTYIHR